MKEILQTIIENLVDNPDAVEIKQTDETNSVLFEVKVAESDMGKVIGKQGKTEIRLSLSPHHTVLNLWIS